MEQQPHVGIFDRHPCEYGSTHYHFRHLRLLLCISAHEKISVHHNYSLGSLALINLSGIRQVCKSTSGYIKKPLTDNHSGILCGLGIFQVKNVSLCNQDVLVVHF